MSETDKFVIPYWVDRLSWSSRSLGDDVALHLNCTVLIWKVPNRPKMMDKFKYWQQLLLLWKASIWLLQGLQGHKVLQGFYYYRCNNYVARKVCFCVSAWTWRHRHYQLIFLITQGSTWDLGNCLLFMLLNCVGIE